MWNAAYRQSRRLEAAQEDGNQPLGRPGLQDVALTLQGLGEQAGCLGRGFGALPLSRQAASGQAQLPARTETGQAALRRECRVSVLPSSQPRSDEQVHSGRPAAEEVADSERRAGS